MRGRGSRRSARCRHSPAQTPARSHSSSTDGTGPAAVHWARAPSSVPRAPCARAQAWVAHGRGGRGRSPARDPSAPPGRPTSGAPSPARSRSDRHLSATGRPTRRCRAGHRGGRGGSAAARTRRLRRRSRFRSRAATHEWSRHRPSPATRARTSPCRRSPRRALPGPRPAGPRRCRSRCAGTCAAASRGSAPTPFARRTPAAQSLRLPPPPCPLTTFEDIVLVLRRTLTVLGMFFHSSEAPPERAADPALRRANLRRIALLFAPYRLRLGGVLLLIMVSAGLGVLPAFLLKRALEAIGRNDTTALSYAAGGMIAIAVVTGALGVIQTLLSNQVGQRVMHDLRAAVFRHLQRLSLAFFTGTRTGEVQSRISNDIGGVQNVVTNTATSIASNVAFTTLQTRLFFPVGSLLGVGLDVQTSLALFDRIFEYLDQPIDIEERPGALALGQAGDVVFDHVWFRYADEWTLQDVSFTVPAGSTTALVGETGSGKTTLGYLVARLYEPTRGKVTIGGIDIRDLSFRALSDLVGVVSQETYLFHESIRENLRFAKPDATDEEIEAAAEAARIHHVITALPEGYDTVVGERGYRFSGGEKQRIAIARTVLRNPPILVLDEATSSLDTETERLVQ